MNNINDTYSINGDAVTEKSPLPTRWFLSRIFCFLLALGIWIYVVNVKTQEYEKTFSLIDISVEGVEELLERNNMSVVNLEESKVNITKTTKSCFLYCFLFIQKIIINIIQDKKAIGSNTRFCL